MSTNQSNQSINTINQLNPINPNQPNQSDSTDAIKTSQTNRSKPEWSRGAARGDHVVPSRGPNSWSQLMVPSRRRVLALRRAQVQCILVCLSVSSVSSLGPTTAPPGQSVSQSVSESLGRRFGGSSLVKVSGLVGLILSLKSRKILKKTSQNLTQPQTTSQDLNQPHKTSNNITQPQTNS